ncbi:MAG: DUF2786 domain-containing protein [Desulfobacteraceae bacterium]|nr:DUF2786 domain-containing protein [Desulfobacteraceae bacterium]
MDKTRGEISQELEQGILAMLYHEWEQVVWGLSLREPTLAARLKRPGILISEMKSTLGQWDPLLGEISLGRELVRKGRWDSVCEVLRHEMAHQLASTFAESRNEKPHGRRFVACCAAIGANPKASGTYKSLEERVWGEGASENDRIMLKVKKLMGLATSRNRHEAELAAAKAGELIARYNLEHIKSNEKRNFESIIITTPSLKRTQAESLAAGILHAHYFVKPVWVPVYLPDRGKMGRALEISGTPTNVRIADYVFAFVLNYALKSWKDYKAANPSCRARSGYMTGVVLGFRQKLDQSQKQRCAQTEEGRDQALVPVKDGQLAAYVDRRYPRVRSTSRVHASTSREAYSDGLEKGKDLVVSKAIAESGVNTGKLLK